MSYDRYRKTLALKRFGFIGVCAVSCALFCAKVQAHPSNDLAQPVRVGVILAESGDAKFIGLAEHAMLAATAAAHNSTLAFVFEDSRGQPSYAKQIAQSFASDKSIIAIIGPSTSAEAVEVSKVAETDNIPVLTLTASDSLGHAPDSRLDWTFRVAPGNNDAAALLARRINQDHRRSVAIFYSDDAFGRNGRDHIATALESLGMNTSTFPILPNGDNGSQQIYFVPYDSDAAVIWAIGDIPRKVASELRLKRYRGRLYLSQGSTLKQLVATNARPTNGAIVVGNLANAQTTQPDVPRNDSAKEYQDLIQKTGISPDEFSAIAFDAFCLLEQRISRTNQLTRERLRNTIRNGDVYSGATGAYRFVEGNPNSVASSSLVTYRVVNDTLSLQMGGGHEEPNKPSSGEIADDRILTRVRFAGGAVDENLVRFYEYLNKTGQLPTRLLSVRARSRLDEDLFGERVLFNTYPKQMTSLLFDLNRSVSHTSYQGAPEILYQSETLLAIPDIAFTLGRCNVPLALQDETLAAAAVRRNLLRARRNPESEEVVRARWAEISKLNPQLPKSVLTLRSRKRLTFPADGFWTEIPIRKSDIKNLSQLILGEPGLPSETVVVEPLRQESKPVLFEAVTVVPTSLASPLPNSTGSTDDPLDAKLEPVLQHVHYKRLNYDPAAQVVVIDSFPAPSTRRIADLGYRSTVQSYLLEGRTMAEVQPVLDATAKTFDVSPERQKDLNDDVCLGHYSTSTYDLTYLSEFSQSVKASGAGLLSPSPLDPGNEHGYFVCGLIAARRNHFGMSGVDPGVSLIAYDLNSQVLYDTISQDLSNSCLESSPCLVNLSYTETDSEKAKALRAFINSSSRRILAVVAAGNSAKATEPPRELAQNCGDVPACDGSQPNVITVTAFSAADDSVLYSRANYQAKDAAIVTLAAPGEGLISTVDNDQFKIDSGTSMAAAITTGAAALIEDMVLPTTSLSVQQIRQRLLATADLETDYGGKVQFGKLNIERASDFPRYDRISSGGSTFRGAIIRSKQQELPAFHPGGVSRQANVTFKFSNLRRIRKNDRNDYWTVAYRDSKNQDVLRIDRSITFSPAGLDPTSLKRRMEASAIVLKTCQQPIPEETWQAVANESAEEGLRTLCEKSTATRTFSLPDIQDLVVRIDAP